MVLDETLHCFRKLGIHIRAHNGEKSYVYNHCDKVFTGKKMLIYTDRTHTEEKPYNCSHCEKAFSKKRNLEIHTESQTVENPFQ